MLALSDWAVEACAGNLGADSSRAVGPEVYLFLYCLRASRSLCEQHVIDASLPHHQADMHVCLSSYDDTHWQTK